jgi:hypothetical protein
MLTAETAAILREAEERFAYFRTLGRDWDSYGGDPPTEQAMAHARRLLEVVCEQFADVPLERLRPFAIAPTPDGGVHVEWRTDDQALAVLVGSEGELAYLLTEDAQATPRYREGYQASWEDILALARRVLRSAAEA